MSHNALRDVYEIAPVEFETARLADGLGFGHGAISAQTIEGAAGNEDLAALTDELLESPQILAPISCTDDGGLIQDDGCGDGRRTGLVFDGERVCRTSLVRPKVFGGGITMAAATRIGLGCSNGLTLATIFEESDRHLDYRGVDYGGHTVEYVVGKKSGCGAIDEAPRILDAAGAYRQEIRATVVSLMGEAPEIDQVLDNFIIAGDVDNDGYNGAEIMAGIIDRGKVVKALADDHMETRIVLNSVPGYTADQGFVREYTGGRAQVFSVDVWRMMELAERLYDDPISQRQALVSELVYTLATAAVLTKGDLPVYSIQPTGNL